MRVALDGDDANRRARIRRRIGWMAATLAIGLGTTAFETPRNYLSAAIPGNRAPTLQIGIPFKDLHPIHLQRSAALKARRLIVTNEDFAEATLEFGDQSVRARLRLAAAPVEAFEGDQWPMRLQVRKTGHLFGQRAMLLTAVSAHNVVDVLFLDHLDRLEGISARLLLVDAVLNGRRLGTMALAEIPSTELLERAERRDGVVVRVDDQGRAVAIEPNRIEQSGQLRTNLARAEQLIASAVRGDRPADQLFDAESLGRFLAVAEHWNQTSRLSWEQLCFYLNPMTDRLEVIGVPTAPTSTAESAVANSTRTPPEVPFADQMLANSRIRIAFESTQREIAEEFADGSAWKRAAQYEGALRALLSRDDRHDRGDTVDSLRNRKHLAPYPRLSSEPVAAANAATEPKPPALDPLAARDPLPHTSVADVLASHPFLDWNAGEQMFQVRPGRWTVRGSVILPDGAGLGISRATTLRFEPRAGLIARGPLRFEGSADAPIVLEGPPGTTPAQLWSGVYLIESDRDSHWKHVIVRNTGGFKRAGWSLPGGVVFRRTHVELEHCTLRSSLADDALNLVHTTFRLRDIDVRDAASDAIDFDYSDGLVERANVSQAVGDGFDLGGSRVDVRNAHFADIEDKAISVGERSELVAQSLEIERVSIGIASKNSSRASVRESVFRRVSLVGLLAYQNRTVYEAGEIYSNDNRFGQTARPALVELGSRIVIDGVEWPAADISVASVAAVSASQ